MNKKNNIYRDGLHYDEMNSFDYDIIFYKDLISDIKGPVLELGCGTGRITVPLADNNREVYGLDINSDMLENAKAKAERKECSIKWIQSDMQSFSLGIKYSVIIIAFDSICHLHTFEEISNCFRSAYNHLNEDGIFIIDVANPNLSYLLRKKEEVFHRASYRNPYGKGKVKVLQRSSYNRATQINFIVWIFEIEGEEIEQYLTKKVYFPNEIDNYLKYSGFKIKNKFGDFNKSIFSKKSKRQIIICEK